MRQILKKTVVFEEPWVEDPACREKMKQMALTLTLMALILTLMTLILILTLLSVLSRLFRSNPTFRKVKLLKNWHYPEELYSS